MRGFRQNLSYLFQGLLIHYVLLGRLASVEFRREEINAKERVNAEGPATRLKELLIVPAVSGMHQLTGAGGRP
ncbi:hypothetical protein NITMOv2_4422 [Nitrospira moscoviensis]|uniref:Uncharacterized protein n=1 Tax=Nitrospira moscoviensis TaxID=42253 RepID=A0A0K2GJI8_NITMO|nr:hypothetical protein NITMOv2_4422 [Nitrospira moscoviensis]